MNETKTAPGRLAIHDSTLNVWNDNVDSHIEAVNCRVKNFLRSEGWVLKIDPDTKKHYPSIAKNFMYGRQGDLELSTRLGGRHLEIIPFQNVANVTNPNGGRYDFDKMAHMPYLLKKQTELTLGKLESLLMTEFGYPEAGRQFPRPGPDSATALEFISHKITSSCHFKPELGHSEYSGDYNRKSGDGALLDHGMPVYVQDRKGRWLTGTAYYNINNMWWVALGKYSWSNRASFELYASKPADLRIKGTPALAATRLAQLIEKAIKAKDFLKAHTLQTVLDKQFSLRAKQILAA